MELESLKVVIETEADPSKVKEYEQELKDLKATYDNLRTIGDNGFLNAKNTFGDDYAEKLHEYQQRIADLESKLASLGGQSNNTGNGLKGMFSGLNISGVAAKITKITAALMGVRTVFSMITRSMNTYLSQNEDLKNKINSIYMAIGSALAPILEFIVNLAVKLVTYINIFVKSLGFAGLNLSKMNKTADSIKKSLAGFDELTNIGGNNDSSSLTNPFEEVKINQDLVKFIETVANALLKVRDAIVFILELVNPVVDFFIDTFNSIHDNLLNGIDSVENAIKGSDLPQWLKNTLYVVLDTFRVIINTIHTLINGLFTGIKQVLNGIINVLKGNFSLGFKQIINGLITVFESFINTCIKGINLLLSPLRSIGNAVLSAIGIRSFSFGNISTIRLPRLATGTNYVPEDMAAILHKGEAVVPKKYNDNNAETNELLKQLISVVNTKEFSAYISQNEIGKSAVNYINRQQRILGGSLV